MLNKNSNLKPISKALGPFTSIKTKFRYNKNKVTSTENNEPNKVKRVILRKPKFHSKTVVVKPKKETETIELSDRPYSINNYKNIDFNSDEDDENEDIEDSDDERDVSFCCLCKCCYTENRHVAFLCDWFTKMFCGIPIYVWISGVIILACLLATLGWLLYMTLKPQIKNNAYFVECSSNADCNTTAGLHCATENGICSCPSYNITGKCDCNRGTYWNGTYCATLMAYNQSKCMYNYNCDTSTGLLCINGTCLCKKPKVWNTTTGICNYISNGCFNDSSYPGTNFMFTTVRRTIITLNFIDFCVNRCYALGYDLFYLAIAGDTNTNCYCSNYSPVSYAPVCSILCFTTEQPGIGYLCGSFRTNSAYRVAYNISIT